MKFLGRLARWLLRPVKQSRALRYAQPDLLAYYWDGSVPLSREIRDISLSGAYLYTNERWYPGTLIRLILRRKQADADQSTLRESIRVLCQVVRVDAQGMGVRFIAPDRKTRKALKRFMSPGNLDQTRNR